MSPVEKEMESTLLPEGFSFPTNLTPAEKVYAKEMQSRRYTSEYNPVRTARVIERVRAANKGIDPVTGKAYPTPSTKKTGTRRRAGNYQQDVDMS
jgi:hypothetical protein